MTSGDFLRVKLLLDGDAPLRRYTINPDLEQMFTNHIQLGWYPW